MPSKPACFLDLQSFHHAGISHAIVSCSPRRSPIGDNAKRYWASIKEGIRVQVVRGRQAEDC